MKYLLFFIPYLLRKVYWFLASVLLVTFCFAVFLWTFSLKKTLEEAREDDEVFRPDDEEAFIVFIIGALFAAAWIVAIDWSILLLLP